MTGHKERLVQEEERVWDELHEIIHKLNREQLSEVGYKDDWSVKDLIAHLGCWAAEAAQTLSRIRLGTYEDEHLDVEALNREFWETCRDLDVTGAMAQLHSGRGRMMEELDALPEEKLDGEAEAWFARYGNEHYTQHLPRLKEWAAKLTGS